MVEITDIHRIAYARVEQACNIPAFEDAWAEVRKLLPPELTNPQSALPTEPGRYEDRNRDYWVLDAQRGWLFDDGNVHNDRVKLFAPFTRLVPDRPQITVDQVVDILRKAITTHECANQIVTLANGATQ